MNIVKSLFAAVLLSLSFQSLSARDTDTIPSIFKDDILFTEVNPLHPFGIFTLDHPFYMGTYTKRGSKFSVGYSMGNNWHPQSTIYYPQNLTSRQRTDVNRILYTDRPYYFFLNHIPVEQKTFSSDGVLQNLSFTYLWKLGKKGSFIFKLNTHLLSEGTAFVHYLASDNFIEWFHDRVNPPCMTILAVTSMYSTKRTLHLRMKITNRSGLMRERHFSGLSTFIITVLCGGRQTGHPTILFSLAPILPCL